mmetsp:Transcript_826/g.841  ORF Transcript_826/g.841 Transcript_826/m.841 type:complete len:538 (+) Transcript_826:62-1675(+)|eukprot:CAMPEP_0182427376 /NCGR_PEP_ID=MMETSP1167-20130531/17124_1 /TAXON_ID=2988 /ORGANISM="Mallomonas Sp, Strain CCMP3275" /LENGTH=537 /DNA_ID=CAMNT_0024609569 /DNA_START=60 /DNA_END=1673 /DNA_ORIENTATION=+
MLRRQLTSKLDISDDDDDVPASSLPFFEKLQARVETINSLLCVGLDPHVKQLPSPDASAAVQFCLKIIEQTSPYAAAFKPNAAFFEAFGPPGIEGLIQVIKAIPNGIPVILDVKRGDIETTAQAYADAAYTSLGATAVTLSPYMGWDSVSPFVTGQHSLRAAFVLCKTSNPSSKEIQEMKLLSGNMLYEQVASLSQEWDNKASLSRAHDSNVRDWGCVGLVVGATDLSALKRVREIASNVWILCPGVGAQGGEIETVCSTGLRSDGSGLLISVSRSLSAASNISLAAETLRDQINVYRKIKSEEICIPLSGLLDTPQLSGLQREFLSQAMRCGALQFGSYVLKSGRESPYFFNAGKLCSGMSFSALGRAYANAVKSSNIEFDVVFGPAYKGIPLATCLAMCWSELYGADVEVAYNRKEAKDHGEGGTLVGAPISGRRILIVDDVITAGTAIREALSLIQREGGEVVGVVVALDRQEWASEREKGSAIQQVQQEQNIPVMAIVQLRHLISYVAENNTVIDSEKLSKLKNYRTTYGVDY